MRIFSGIAIIKTPIINATSDVSDSVALSNTIIFSQTFRRFEEFKFTIN